MEKCMGLFLLISFLLIIDSSASCFFSDLKSEMTASKRLRFYCELKVEGLNMMLLPGSKVMLADRCMDCTCSSAGLQCCGFGRQAGVVSFPDNCMAIDDGCQSILVQKDNTTRSCSTNETIDFDALSKQLPHPDNTYGVTESTASSSSSISFSQSGSSGQTSGVSNINNIRSRLYDYLNSMFPGRLPSLSVNPALNRPVTFAPEMTTPATSIFGERLPPVQTHETIYVPDAVYPYANDLFLPWLLFT